LLAVEQPLEIVREEVMLLVSLLPDDLLRDLTELAGARPR
jgi:hypothetical protein